MSVSYFVRYDITTRDTAEFLRYFREVHVPLATRWPGLKGVVLHTPIEWNDPYAITRGSSVLLVQFEFDSAAALSRALFSPERENTRRDFQNFPAFAGTVTHQALTTETVWTRK